MEGAAAGAVESGEKKYKRKTQLEKALIRLAISKISITEKIRISFDLIDTIERILYEWGKKTRLQIDFEELTEKEYDGILSSPDSDVDGIIPWEYLVKNAEIKYTEYEIDRGRVTGKENAKKFIITSFTIPTRVGWVRAREINFNVYGKISDIDSEEYGDAVRLFNISYDLDESSFDIILKKMKCLDFVYTKVKDLKRIK